MENVVKNHCDGASPFKLALFGINLSDKSCLFLAIFLHYVFFRTWFNNPQLKTPSIARAIWNMIWTQDNVVSAQCLEGAGGDILRLSARLRFDRAQVGLENLVLAIQFLSHSNRQLEVVEVGILHRHALWGRKNGTSPESRKPLTSSAGCCPLVLRSGEEAEWVSAPVDPAYLDPARTSRSRVLDVYAIDNVGEEHRTLVVLPEEARLQEYEDACEDRDLALHAQG